MDVHESNEMRYRWTLFESSGLPRRHAKASKLTQWEPEQLDAARRLGNGIRAGGLVALLGPVGTGKTLLVAAAVRWMTMEQGKGARYWRFADLLDHLRTRTYDGGENAAKVLQSMARVSLLVLDEIDKRRWTEDEAQWFVRLIDHRYGEETPTVVVANLTREGLASSLDASVRDRMFEGGTVIELTGESKRRATA